MSRFVWTALLPVALAVTGCDDVTAGHPLVSIAAPELSPEPLNEAPPLPPELALAQPQRIEAVAVAPLELPVLRVLPSALQEPLDAASLGEVRSVLLRFEVSGAPVTSEVALELIAPGEVVYERRTAALTVGPFQSETLQFELPVAGTLIDINGLAGQWAAQLTIDGEPVVSQEFELKP